MHTLKLCWSMLATGVTSAAEPVKKQPTNSDISSGLIFLSTTLMPFDFEISITHRLVKKKKKESGIGVCSSPLEFLKI